METFKIGHVTFQKFIYVLVLLFPISFDLRFNIFIVTAR
jgi:hypothetical protein